MGQLYGTTQSTNTQNNDESTTIKQATIKSNKLMSKHPEQIVLNAYIFDIEQNIVPNAIIPDVVISICFQYYNCDELMYLIND